MCKKLWLVQSVSVYLVFCEPVLLHKFDEIRGYSEAPHTGWSIEYVHVPQNQNKCFNAQKMPKDL